jgi:protein O-mannosyl-transferase
VHKSPLPRFFLERRDIVHFFAIALTLPVVWIIFLGWDGRDPLAGHDALYQTLPVIQDLFANSFDWKRVLIRPQLLGGAHVAGSGHLFPVFTVAGWLGLSAVSAINLMVLFIQLCLAFFGIRLALDLAAIWNPSSKPRGFSQFASILLLAFLPSMAWRIDRGHMNLALGSLVLLCGVTLAVALFRRTLTLSLLVVAILFLANTLPGSGQQAVLYSVVFGFPVAIALVLTAYWSRDSIQSTRGNLSSSVWGLFFIFFGVLLVCVPRFWSLYDFARSTDSARSSSSSVIYSYFVQGTLDWITALPWSTKALRFARPEWQWHETNIPLGPLLFCLFLIPLASWKRGRAVIVGFFLSVAFAMAFGMGLSPFSDFLPELLPVLKLFRAPGRAVLPLSILLAPLGISALLALESSSVSKSLALLPLFLLPLVARLFPQDFIALGTEGISWALIFLLVGFLFLKKKMPPFPGGISGILVFLSVTSLLSFQSRLSDPKVHEILSAQEPLRKGLLATEPSLKSPLVRFVPGFQHKGLDANQIYSLGLSSLDGYWYPTSRFQSLVAALDNSPEETTAMGYHFTVRDPSLAVLRHLYNVKYVVPYDGKQYGILPFAETAGSAWFSSQIAYAPSMKVLAHELREKGDKLASHAKEKVWLVQNDPKLSLSLFSSFLPERCQGSQAQVQSFAKGGQKFVLDTKTQGNCPLTLATNYLQNWRAKGLLGNGSEISLDTFPSYGALLGIVVPAGMSQVIVEYQPTIPVFAEFLPAIGWFFLLGVLLFFPGLGIKIKKFRLELSPQVCRIILLVAVISVFFRTIGFDYVDYDDHKHIFENPALLKPSLSSISQFWIEPFFGLYTPVTYTVWSALAFLAPIGAMGRIEPGFFHFFNLLLHMLNVFLSFALLREILEKRMKDSSLAVLPAFLGALLFALHPVQVETVAWISGMKDLLFTSFALGAILLSLRAERSNLVAGSHSMGLLRFARNDVVATLLFILAMLSKPTAVTLPFAVFFCRAFLQGKSFRKSFDGWLLLWVVLSLPILVLTKILQPDSTVAFVPPFLNRILVASDAIVFYLGKILFPSTLIMDYGRTPQWVLAQGAQMFLPVIVLGLLGTLVYLFRKRAPWVIAAIALFVAGVLPVLGLVPFQFQKFSTVNDHYLYFSMIGLSLFTAFLAGIAREHGAHKLGVAFTVWICFLAWVSSSQVAVWKDSVALFSKAVEHNPRSLVAQTNLAYALVERKELGKAALHLEEAVKLSDEPRLKLSLASVLLQAGSFDRARNVCLELQTVAGFERDALRCLTAVKEL